MKNSIMHTLNELRAARAEDRAAKALALQRGLASTRPLTESRLMELCALGDRMRDAEARKERLRAQLRWLLLSRKATAESPPRREAREGMQYSASHHP
jgi:hypothetical protein